jgi:hypothetical protein
MPSSSMIVPLVGNGDGLAAHMVGLLDGVLGHVALAADHSAFQGCLRVASISAEIDCAVTGGFGRMGLRRTQATPVSTAVCSLTIFL